MNRLGKLARHPASHLLALLAIGGLLLLRGPIPQPQWSAQPAANQLNSGEPVYTSLALTPHPTKIVHAGQAVALPDGRIAAFWFGGTKEGRTDIQIYRQILQNGEPQEEPKAVLSPEGLGNQLGIYVKNLGNPVPFYYQDQLHLFVVSVALGGWATAQVSHLISDDLGDTWHTAKQPITSPFFNQSTLVRTSAVPTSQGFLLPAYFEQGRINPMWLQFDEDARFIASHTLPVQGLQPEFLLTGKNTADVLMRPTRTGTLGHVKVHADGTDERPQRFDPPESPSSAVSAVMLSPEHWIMAHNPGRNRSTLAISQTRDGGESWEQLRVVAREAGERFSYPHLTMGPDGYFHLLYTHKREHIQYVRFNLPGVRP